ncbi:hypothetical protein HWD35_10215 [Tsukamurella tyrosinosolvens]|uniref:TetR/AcrR family transcriptional regulator n=1 Tax=Tsukamurella tyrosinosolvens TaxID=57704 RepID=UPI001CE04527|nr:hypothetical protein [Tsukamurella tyrosinosolvens]MCA4995085.1 hypothetical protein [Tsukamurella tyrosinosolvens]
MSTEGDRQLDPRVRAAATKKEKTRQAIREAVVLLANRNVQFGLKDVCNAAKVSQATFYNHYSSLAEASEEVLLGMIESRAKMYYDLAFYHLKNADLEIRSAVELNVRLLVQDLTSLRVPLSHVRNILFEPILYYFSIIQLSVHCLANDSRADLQSIEYGIDGCREALALVGDDDTFVTAQMIFAATVDCVPDYEDEPGPLEREIVALIEGRALLLRDQTFHTTSISSGSNRHPS